MKLLKLIKEYIIPIISILLAIASFFTGRWLENKEFKLERDKFSAQQINFNRELLQKTQEIARLKDQHQNDLQFKYVDLLTKNLNEENLFKAEIIIHLITDPEVQSKFSSFTQTILSKNDKINPQTKKIVRGNLANTSYDSRIKIETRNNKLTDSIINISIKNPTKVSQADTALLEKFDKRENDIINSKYEVYQEFLVLLEQLRSTVVITKVQLTKYTDLHVEIINEYANNDLKSLMNELYNARKDLIVGPKTKGLIDNVTKMLKNEISKSKWCKERYYIKWKNIRCSVVDLNSKNKYVIVNLFDIENDKILHQNLKLKVGDAKIIENLNVKIKLEKIDNAGKNIFTQAGYFLFTDMN